MSHGEWVRIFKKIKFQRFKVVAMGEQNAK